VRVQAAQSASHLQLLQLASGSATTKIAFVASAPSITQMRGRHGNVTCANFGMSKKIFRQSTGNANAVFSVYV
jgi:tripartite-type tricarboxylate transporter receptor subunit TctC